MKTLIHPAEAGAQAVAIYERLIKPLVKADDRHKTLFIDIDTGDFEVDADEDAAEDRLRARRPDGFFVIMRADGGPAGHFGSTTG